MLMMDVIDYLVVPFHLFGHHSKYGDRKCEWLDDGDTWKMLMAEIMDHNKQDYRLFFRINSTDKSAPFRRRI